MTYILKYKCFEQLILYASYINNTLPLMQLVLMLRGHFMKVFWAAEWSLLHSHTLGKKFWFDLLQRLSPVHEISQKIQTMSAYMYKSRWCATPEILNYNLTMEEKKK